MQFSYENDEKCNLEDKKEKKSHSKMKMTRYIKLMHFFCTFCPFDKKKLFFLPAFYIIFSFPLLYYTVG